VKLRNTIEKRKEVPKQDEASTTTRVQITEFQHSLEFLSVKYDTLSTEKGTAKKELQKLSSRPLELTAKGDRIGDAYEQLKEYRLQVPIQRFLF
jgi:hypothetical protein